jgi:hypothetical protein
MTRDNNHYAAIREFYGDRRANRSGIPLIAHIDEGLCILDHIGSSLHAKEAFCLHPLLQDNDDLIVSMADGSIFQRFSLDPAAIVLAMEYRATANAYLSHHCAGPHDEIHLSCLRDVNEMLIADKVQNRKDFEIHHLDRHENSATLFIYFNNWLRKLGVSEERYQELIRHIRENVAAA